MADNDAVLAAIGALTELVKDIGTRVKALEAGPPEPEPVHLDFVNEPQYTPLIRWGGGIGAELRRVELARLLPEHAALLFEGGARGLYRALDKPEGKLRLEFPTHIARLLVEDACAEDIHEGQDMARDLLKDWGDAAAPVHGVESRGNTCYDSD